VSDRVYVMGAKGGEKDSGSEYMSKVLLVLVLVLLVVSLISTYSVLMLNYRMPEAPGQQATGVVRLQLNNPYGGDQEPDTDSGVVRLTILPAN
jgi:hypothetical protein